MWRPNSHSGQRIPKLPVQPTTHQFSLQTLLIFALIAGPIAALLTQPTSALIASYRSAISLFEYFPRSDFGFVLKFLIVGFFAFGIVPYCVAKLHPLFAWVACVVSAGALFVLWQYATDNVVWHHPVDEARSFLPTDDPKRVFKDQTRMMLDLELAAAATAVFIGFVIGGLVSLFSRKFN
jgi:hypothetical protein